MERSREWIKKSNQERRLRLSWTGGKSKSNHGWEGAAKKVVVIGDGDGGGGGGGGVLREVVRKEKIYIAGMEKRQDVRCVMGDIRWKSEECNGK